MSKEEIEAGKPVWETLPPVFGEDDEMESMRLIGAAILGERNRVVMVLRQHCEVGGICAKDQEELLNLLKEIREGN